MINYFENGIPLINTINEQYNTISKHNNFKYEESKDLNKQFENYFACKLNIYTYPVFRFRTKVRISDVNQNKNNITKLCNNFVYRLDNYLSKQYREERKDAAFKLLKAEKLLIEE